MHVQMKFKKFENCTFCDITSSNVHGFSSNLQNRCSLSRQFSWGVEILCSHQNYTSEIWSKLKKWNISLNFWVNIGMWPIIFMWLTMPNVTVMSEYMIYIVWKLIVMFCPVTCVIHVTISKIGCHRLTQQCWHACTNEILEIWKLYILWNNFIKCAWIFLQTFRTDILLSRQF